MKQLIYFYLHNNLTIRCLFFLVAAWFMSVIWINQIKHSRFHLNSVSTPGKPLNISFRIIRSLYRQICPVCIFPHFRSVQKDLYIQIITMYLKICFFEASCIPFLYKSKSFTNRIFARRKLFFLNTFRKTYGIP